jgi:hypothetical protein
MAIAGKALRRDDMSDNFILVKLEQRQKAMVLDEASHCISDDETINDLKNKRKQWIRFHKFSINDIVGELSYVCNRSTSARKSMLLDELISDLEYYEKHG